VDGDGKRLRPAIRRVRRAGRTFLGMSAMGDCPKRMVYGPCGGVRPGGTCEVDPRPCPFVAADLPLWPDAVPGAGARSTVLQRLSTRPVVLADLTLDPYDLGGLRRSVEIAAPGADALLVGEHQNRPDFPPTMLAREIEEAGGRPWVTLTCRDRNRVVLEQELAGLRALAVDAVLCVTGDARAASVRTGVTQVFDLDGTRLTALAAAAGLAAAVPESPHAPPIQGRPERVSNKERAGAAVCVLNHVADVAAVDRFVRAARAAGASIPIIAAVAVFTDARSAAVLNAFPGLGLDPVRVEEVLTDSDPVGAGIRTAVAEARALLNLPDVAGVNLSGRACAGGGELAAEIKAEVGRQLLAG
jgi:methylenetetrahydrofolate reductase (NADPH)